MPRTSVGVSAIKSYFRSNPTPFSLHFELTTKCNEKCIHCYLPSGSTTKLDAETVCRVLSEFRSMGGLHVEFSGGECFLFHGFHEVITHAQELDLSISIMSNLICIDEKLADYIERISPSLVQVSLYSMDSETHDKITQVKGSFRKTYNALGMLFSRNVPVEISCPCMSNNATGYEKLLNFADEHKIRVCSDCVLLAKYSGDSDNLKVRMSPSECEAVLRAIISHERHHGVASEGPVELVYDDIKESKICDIGVDSIRVNANGDYYVCPCFQGFPVGNCFTDTLQLVWEKSPQLTYLRSLKWNDFPTCLHCSNLKYCKPCMVRNYNESGDLFSPSPYFCQFTEIIKRLSSE
ncbi:MAG: radical SAM protein [Kiritimatiellia bacterium]